MHSRRAKILVPLAVELAFALAVFTAILATDGGRYGLGAKAVLENLRERYGQSRTYTATVAESFGAYPRLREAYPSEEKELRTFLVACKKPCMLAGCLTQGGKKTYMIEIYTRIAATGHSTLADGEGVKYVIGAAVLPVDPRPWRGPFAHAVLLMQEEWQDVIRPVAPPRRFSDRGYVELQRRRGRAGGRSDVLVFHWNETEVELWADPESHVVQAVVYTSALKPYTELYEDVRFDEPIDDGVFDFFENGFDNLKAWIAEREKAHTN